MKIDSIDQIDMAITVKKQSDTGIFKNQRLLLIKSGFISYYSNKPSSYVGNVRSIQLSGQLPKMTLSATNIQSIDQKGKYLLIKFNKKYLINLSKLSSLISGQIDENEALKGNEEGQIQWSFKCESIELAQMFMNQILICRSNPDMKPRISQIIKGYREGKKGIRPESLQYRPTEMFSSFGTSNLPFRLSQQPNLFRNKNKVGSQFDEPHRQSTQLKFLSEGLVVLEPHPQNTILQENEDQIQNENKQMKNQHNQKDLQSRDQKNQEQKNNMDNPLINQNVGKIRQSQSKNQLVERFETQNIFKQNIPHQIKLDQKAIEQTANNQNVSYLINQQNSMMLKKNKINFELNENPKTLKSQNKEQLNKNLQKSLDKKIGKISSLQKEKNNNFRNSKSLKNKKQGNQHQKKIQTGYGKQTFPYFPFVVNKTKEVQNDLIDENGSQISPDKDLLNKLMTPKSPSQQKILLLSKQKQKKENQLKRQNNVALNKQSNTSNEKLNKQLNEKRPKNFKKVIKNNVWSDFKRSKKNQLILNNIELGKQQDIGHQKLCANQIQEDQRSSNEETQIKESEQQQNNLQHPENLPPALLSQKVWQKAQNDHIDQGPPKIQQSESINYQRQQYIEPNLADPNQCTTIDKQSNLNQTQIQTQAQHKNLQIDSKVESSDPNDAHKQILQVQIEVPKLTNSISLTNQNEECSVSQQLEAMHKAIKKEFEQFTDNQQRQDMQHPNDQEISDAKYKYKQQGPQMKQGSEYNYSMEQKPQQQQKQATHNKKCLGRSQGQNVNELSEDSQNNNVRFVFSGMDAVCQYQKGVQKHLAWQSEIKQENGPATEQQNKLCIEQSGKGMKSDAKANCSVQDQQTHIRYQQYQEGKEPEVEESTNIVNRIQQVESQLLIPRLQISKHSDGDDDAISFGNLQVDAKHYSECQTPRFWDADHQAQQQKNDNKDGVTFEGNDKWQFTHKDIDHHNLLQRASETKYLMNQQVKQDKPKNRQDLVREDTKIQEFAQNLLKVPNKTKESNRNLSSQSIALRKILRCRRKQSKGQQQFPTAIVKELLSISNDNKIKQVAADLLIKEVGSINHNYQIFDCESIMFGRRIRTEGWCLYLSKTQQKHGRICQFYRAASNAIHQMGYANKFRVPKVFSLMYKSHFALFVESPLSEAQCLPIQIKLLMSQVVVPQKIDDILKQTKFSFQKQSNSYIIWVNPDYIQGWSTHQYLQLKDTQQNQFQTTKTNQDQTKQQVRRLWKQYSQLNKNEDYQSAFQIQKQYIKMVDKFGVSVLHKENEIEIKYLCKATQIRSRNQLSIIEKLHNEVFQNLQNNYLDKAAQAVYWYGLKLLAEGDLLNVHPPEMWKYLNAFTTTAQLYFFEHRFREVEDICSYVLQTVFGSSMASSIISCQFISRDRIANQICLRVGKCDDLCLHQQINRCIVLLFASKIQIKKTQKYSIDNLYASLLQLIDWLSKQEGSKNYFQLVVHKIYLCHFKANLDQQQIASLRRTAFKCAMASLQNCKQAVSKSMLLDRNRIIVSTVIEYIDELIAQTSFTQAISVIKKHIHCTLFQSSQIQLASRLNICQIHLNQSDGVTHLNFIEHLYHYLHLYSQCKSNSEAAYLSALIQPNESYYLKIIKNIATIFCSEFAYNDYHLCDSLLQILNSTGLSRWEISCILQGGMSHIEPPIRRRITKKYQL